MQIAAPAQPKGPLTVLVNTRQPGCRSVDIPGIKPGMKVVPASDGQHLLIATPSQLLQSNLDGTGIHKLFDLPKDAGGRLLGSADGSFLFLGGYVLPGSGPRGTRFAWKLTGGPGRQGATVTVVDPSGAKTPKPVQLDAQGGASDWIFVVGVDGVAGTYSVQVVAGGSNTASANFQISD